MRFFIAFASLCAFCWLAYVVLTDKIADVIAAYPQAEAAQAYLARFIEDYGPDMTALALVGAGSLLSFLVIAVGRREA